MPVHKGETPVVVGGGRGGDGAADGAAQRARRVQLRGDPARGGRVRLRTGSDAAAHQVHRYLAQVLIRAAWKRSC